MTSEHTGVGPEDDEPWDPGARYCITWDGPVITVEQVSTPVTGHATDV